MDAIVDILRASGMPLNAKWVDDLAQLRSPIAGNSEDSYVYPFDVQDIFELTRPLGVPWKLGKCFAFSFLLVYLGFLWDLRHRSVSLPEAKRIKYLGKVSLFLSAASRGKVFLQDALSLNGTLSHITFVFPLGRAYLANLCTFI
jgi:hypothetical protein